MNSNQPKIYISLLVMWLGHILIDLMIGIWPLYKTLAGIDLAVAGLIAGICAFFGEGLQVVFGSLGDKGYRKLMIGIGILFSVGAAALPYVHTIFLIGVLYMMTSIGSGMFHPSGVAVVSSLTQKRKGLFVTIFASGGALGMAMSQLTFSQIYLNFDQKTLILAIPALLLVAFLVVSNLAGMQGQPAKPGRRYGFQAMKKLFKNKSLVKLYFSQVFNQSIFWGSIFLLPDVLISKGYPDWICYGGGHFCFIIAGALMLIPGGALADKYSPRTVLFTSSMLGILFFYTFLFSPALPTFLLLPLLFVLGATLGIANPVAVALGNQIMPSRPGLVSAFLMGLVWCISESLGPGGGGLLTKCFTDNPAEKALSIIGLFYIGTIICTSYLPREIIEDYDIEYA